MASIRLGLTRASIRRNQLLDNHVYPWLLKQLGPSEIERLNILRSTGKVLRTKSSEHIGRWSMDEVVRDWAGYQYASARMRAVMRERISAERQLLYPYLPNLPAAA